MKILCLGDVHLKAFAGNRTDDIFATQMSKLEQVYRITQQHKISTIIQVGDLFNHPEVPNEVLSETIRFFFKFMRQDIRFFTILGQHDKYMRGGLEKSPTRVLAEANLLTVLPNEGHKLFECKSGGKATQWDLVGCHFGDPVPPAPSQNSVLVVHQMIHPDKLHPLDAGFMTPRKFLSDYSDYRLILCGDYHGSFAYQTKNRGIFNPGAMTRQSISDKEAIPHVLVIEIGEELTCQKVALDCPADPFREQVKKATASTGVLNEMLGRLRQGSEALSLERSAKAYFEREHVALSVQNLIWAYLEN